MTKFEKLKRVHMYDFIKMITYDKNGDFLPACPICRYHYEDESFCSKGKSGDGFCILGMIEFLESEE